MKKRYEVEHIFLKTFQTLQNENELGFRMTEQVAEPFTDEPVSE